MSLFIVSFLWPLCMGVLHISGVLSYVFCVFRSVCCYLYFEFSPFYPKNVYKHILKKLARIPELTTVSTLQ